MFILAALGIVAGAATIQGLAGVLIARGEEKERLRLAAEALQEKKDYELWKLEVLEPLRAPSQTPRGETVWEAPSQPQPSAQEPAQGVFGLDIEFPD